MYRVGLTNFCHAVCLRAHGIVARLAKGEYSLLLLLFAAVIPVDFVFFIHCYGFGDSVLRNKICF